MADRATSTLAETVRESGLVPAGSRGVVLVSGGADSAAAAAGLAKALGPDAVLALHLNYGLRPDSDRDEETCRALCGGLGLDLIVERPRLGEGTSRRRRVGPATRQPSGFGRIGDSTGWPPATPAPIWRRPSSTGWRPPRPSCPAGPEAAPGGGTPDHGARSRGGARARERGAPPLPRRPSNLEPVFARNRIRGELPVLTEIGADARG